jgi:hypothetical protein
LYDVELGVLVAQRHLHKVILLQQPLDVVPGLLQHLHGGGRHGGEDALMSSLLACALGFPAVSQLDVCYHAIKQLHNATKYMA